MTDDDPLDEFLAGERPDDIAIFVADDAVDDPDALEAYGRPVAGGTVLVLEGETGRGVFRAATGMDAMSFARKAMRIEGDVDPDLTGGTCPNCGADAVQLCFAFVQEQNEAVGGDYAEGNVVHAYALCECDVAYSEKWVA